MSEWKADPATHGEEREVSDETKVPEEHDGPPIQWRTCPYCVARNEPDDDAQFDPASDRCLASALDDNARYAVLVAEKDKRVAELESVLGSIIGAECVSFSDDEEARKLLGWEPAE